MNKSKEQVLVILAFIAIYFVWGTTYLAVIFALESFPPFLLSALRFGISGALLVGYCLLRREPLPSLRRMRIIAICGILMLVGGSGLVTWSEQYVFSGHAAVATATEPFIFLLFDRRRWRFYLSQRLIIAGLIIGFIGVVAFIALAPVQSSDDVAPALKAAGYAVLFLSCVLWVGGSLYAKNSESRGDELEVSSAVIVSLQLISAGLFSLLLSLACGEFNKLSTMAITFNATAGLAYLTFMGSIVAFFSFMWLLTVRPPAQVSTHTYVNPVVAVFMGWWILHEPVNAAQLVAVGLILLGVLLTNLVKRTEQPG
jgi:drug/metabolite transporter (DMT)-like permease